MYSVLRTDEYKDLSLLTISTATLLNWLLVTLETSTPTSTSIHQKILFLTNKRSNLQSMNLPSLAWTSILVISLSYFRTFFHFLWLTFTGMGKQLKIRRSSWSLYAPGERNIEGYGNSELIIVVWTVKKNGKAWEKHGTDLRLEGAPVFSVHGCCKRGTRTGRLPLFIPWWNLNRVNYLPCLALPCAVYFRSGN